MPGKISGIVALVLLALLLVACGPDSTSTPTPSTGFDPAEASKVDTILRDLLAQYNVGGVQAARTYALERGLIDDQDRVRFGLTLSEPGAVSGVTDKLKQMGGEVYQTNGSQLAVAVNLTKLTGYLNNKRDFLTELASLKEVRELRVLLRPALDWTGLAEAPSGAQAPPAEIKLPNEGVRQIGADKWQAAGFKGQGVKIGIIDGGFKGYKAGFGSSLPPATKVTFRSFLLDNTEGGEVHGVAVAEIVHSLAPDATLLLASIEDEVGFSQAVDWLLANKVQIIQASLGWAGLFPGDGTGRMNEQLDKARKQGVLPVISVGNYGQSHYSAVLNPNADNFQRFGTDNRVMLKLTAQANTAWVALRWDEKWDHPQTNLDLYLLDGARQPLGSSRNEQGATSPKPPTELVPFRTTPGQTYYLQIRLTGPKPAVLPRLHLFAYNGLLEESTAEGSVATPGDAQGAISVGAVNWSDGTLESYSSRGPTVDGRLKPELMGPTRVHTQTLGKEQIFAGTSASAPQVSGTFALLWSAAPELKAEQVVQYLLGNATRPASAGLTTPLRDPAMGYGRVQLGPVEAAQRGPSELLVALPAGPAFQDDFQGIGSGLPDNAVSYYGKLPQGSSAYFIRANEAGVLSWSSYLQKSFEEFRADFEAAPLQADPAIFYGLAFWQQGPQDYYAFLVAGDRYSLLKHKGADWTALLDWQRNPALNSRPDPAVRQRLSVEATTNYVRLRAGETVLQTLGLKEARPGGRLGFVAGLFNTARPVANEVGNSSAAFAVFNNLAVMPLTTR